MEKQAFILIGRSGCGKGTQGKLLIDALRAADSSRGVLHIETGAEMRQFIQGATATPRMAKGITEGGGLQPEFIAIYQWANVLVQRYNGNDHLVFDGSPRKVHEAGTLDSIFPFYGFEKPWILNLDVSVDEIHRRLQQRGRNDDTRDAIERRLAWYESDVAPIVAAYRTDPNYRFLNIDGNAPIEAVHAEIVKQIGL